MLQEQFSVFRVFINFAPNVDTEVRIVFTFSAHLGKLFLVRPHTENEIKIHNPYKTILLVFSIFFNRVRRCVTELLIVVF